MANHQCWPVTNPHPCPIGIAIAKFTSSLNLLSPASGVRPRMSLQRLSEAGQKIKQVSMRMLRWSALAVDTLSRSRLRYNLSVAHLWTCRRIRSMVKTLMAGIFLHDASVPSLYHCVCRELKVCCDCDNFLVRNWWKSHDVFSSDLWLPFICSRVQIASMLDSHSPISLYNPLILWPFLRLPEKSYAHQYPSTP